MTPILREVGWTEARHNTFTKNYAPNYLPGYTLLIPDRFDSNRLAMNVAAIVVACIKSEGRKRAFIVGGSTELVFQWSSGAWENDPVTAHD